MIVLLGGWQVTKDSIGHVCDDGHHGSIIQFDRKRFCDHCNEQMYGERYRLAMKAQADLKRDFTWEKQS